jgi:hypothetical protein
MKNELHPHEGPDPTGPALEKVLATFNVYEPYYDEPIGERVPGYPGFRVFGYTLNGIQVIVDPVNSHAATHLEDTPGLGGLLAEVLAKKEVDVYAEGDGDTMIFDMDLERPVGVSYQVPTDETDDIVYAVRKNRDTYMRFTRSRPPEPTSCVSVILKRETNSRYSLFSGWVGPRTPAIPGTQHATPESFDFWTTHALVWGTQEVDEASITTQCPWTPPR